MDTGLDSLKKVVHKTGEFLGSKIADAVPNLYNNKTVNTKAVGEIIIPSGKREEILNKSRQLL